MDLSVHLGWLLAVGALALLVRHLVRRRSAHLEALRRYADAAADDTPLPALPPPPGGAIGALQSALVRALARRQERIDTARLEHRRLQAVLDGMVEGVVVLDAHGIVQLCNRGAERLLQLPPGGGHAGRPLIELTRHPDVHRLVRWAVSDGRPDHEAALEIAIGDRDASVLRVTVTPIAVDANAGLSFILVFHDITPLKRLERVRRDFVANVSHELRTPLAAIAGYTETLLGGALDDPERARRFLGIIERHTERLGRLVDDLLTLSDLELGRTAMHRGPVGLDEVVAATFEVVHGKAEQGGVHLVAEVAADLPPLDADRDRLEQALLNLVDNAIKYTPAGGRVTVRARRLAPEAVPEALRGRDAQYGELVVSDTGAGVPPEDLPRLTERFYRVDKARARAVGGTGLGLAIVKHIVQAHGGALHIDSELQRGTTVQLVLPLYDAGGELRAAGEPGAPGVN